MNKKNFPSLLSLVFGAFVLLTACGSDPIAIQSAKAFVKPEQTYSELKLLYLDKKPTWVSGRIDPTLSLQMLGYSKLPALLEKRVPVVFGMNGIKAEYASVPANSFGRTEAAQAARWSQSGGTNTPILVIGTVDGSSWDTSKYNGNQMMFVTMQADLLDFKTRQRLWTAKFENAVTIAASGRQGFNQEYVDQMLKVVLEQLAKDGMIQLPDNTAKVPGAELADKR